MKDFNWRVAADRIKTEQPLIGTIAARHATLFHKQESGLSRLDSQKVIGVMDTPDCLQRMASDASQAIVAATESALRNVINLRLGCDDWTLDDLKGRVGISHPQNKPGVDVYFLDGKPLVTLYPLKSEGSTSEIRMYREYKIHD